MASTGAKLEDQGDKLRRLNGGVGGRPPGEAGSGSSRDDAKRNSLIQIGVYLTARAQRRFQTQTFGDRPWVERMTPNIPGIISDLDRGATIKERRWPPHSRPANVDTGRLRGSITWRLTDENTVQVGSNLPYAAEAQNGGEVEIPISDKVKDALRDYLDKHPERSTPALEWCTGKDIHAFDFERAERIYIGIEDEDEKNLLAIVRRWFSGEAYLERT